MRIAYLLTSLGIGGAERQVIGLARRMAQRGHVVKLFILLPPGKEDWLVNSGPQPLEATHLNVRKQPLNVLQALTRGAAEFRAFRPGLIHSHNFHGNLVARILHLFLPQTPVLSTIHNVYEGGWHRMLAYRLTDPLSRRTVAVSEAARERYVRLHAVPAAKISVIRNGIETEEFTPNPARRAETRTALDLRNEFLWIATGRLAPAKDYPNLLRAFAQIRTASIPTRLCIAGSGTPEHTAHLQALASSLGVAGAIQWLGIRNDLPALLDAADAFVLSSAWEGMPLALGEAMSMEKPVVATDVGGVRELTGESAQLVPALSTEALAAAMLRTMQLSPQYREKIGRAARTRILENFSMDRQADQWEQIYADLLH
jgi:glycosyltransferase involved in cell wall biosynthesis